RTLSQPPKSQPAQGPVELDRQDLDAYTRMLGRVFVDTSGFFVLSADLRRQLHQVATMIGNRELRDAIARLVKLQRKKSPLELAAIQLFIGLSYFELGQPTSALSAFREGVRVLNIAGPAAADTIEIRARARLLALLAFNAGYLLQFYSLPESALGYYQLSRQALELISEPAPELAGALFNNLGVAALKTGDTVMARQAYLAAVDYIDTLGFNPASERLRKNISHLLAQPPSVKTTKSSTGQHQPGP
ncbi:MAG: hypothetical protein ACUVUR_02180, partial [bacterium]